MHVSLLYLFKNFRHSDKYFSTYARDASIFVKCSWLSSHFNQLLSVSTELHKPPQYYILWKFDRQFWDWNIHVDRLTDWPIDVTKLIGAGLYLLITDILQTRF
jgi:hypothetical protein